MKKFVVISAIALACVSISSPAYSMPMGQEPTASEADVARQLHLAEVVQKYGGKQGLFLVDGSVADFKTGESEIYVTFDWDKALDAAAAAAEYAGKEAKETKVPVEQCMAEYNTKFVGYFNAHCKNVKMVTEADNNAKYRMNVCPATYYYTQGGVLLGGKTTVMVSGLIYITEQATGAQVAELYFNRMWTIKSDLGKAGESTANTLKTWRAAAEQVDDDLIKMFKKGK